MEAQLLHDESSTGTFNPIAIDMPASSMTRNFSYLSTWLGIPKAISTPSSSYTIAHNDTTISPSPRIQVITPKRGQLDDIANGICTPRNDSRQASTASCDSKSASIELSESNGTTPDWKQRMIDKNEAAKKEVTNIMDDSLNRVIAKLEKKPLTQRDSGADSYASSVSWIMWSVKSIIDRVK